MIAVAARDFDRPLQEELGENFVQRFDRLFEFKGERLPHWSRNIWLEPKRAEFSSISQAAKLLREIQRNWYLHPTASHRRAHLIQEQLPPIKFKARPFPTELPTAPLGAWTLLDERTLLYSARCSSPFPDGEIEFVEDKIGPPSRAYLKLWEAFTLEQKRPGPGDRVLDLGSSPGGWTWVLDQLGCNVVSVDKAPLTGTYSERVEYLQESAFALEPRDHVDWLFSDVICYPERLFSLVEKWLDRARNIVCTVKFQGPTNHDMIEKFLSIPGGKFRYLTANKHELTWLRLS